MAYFQSTARTSVRRGRAPGVLMLVVFWLLAGLAVPGRAVEVPSLYTAEVRLDRDRPDARAAAYRAALAQVVLRVSGPAVAADPEHFERLFPDPAAYVVQFRPGSDDTLWVSFDGAAVERVLRAAGETVWGSDRPLTLVWLAVDWGQGEREIIGSDDPERTADAARSIDRNRLLRSRVLDMAERRGLPVLFPLLDTDDRRNLSFSDIWGGFDEQLVEASARYDVRSILVGRIRADAGQRNRWTWYFGGEQQTLSGEPEIVINQIADQLAAEFAISGAAPLETIELRVGGIDSVADFGNLSRLLAGLAVVENFALTTVAGEEVHFRVESHGGAERLRRTLRFEGLIEQEVLPGTPLSAERDAPLVFFYDAGAAGR